ncbi:MAG: 30S ribosomal protein S21 [Candidatus Zambryskibacteria bacterium]|nr:30S ribosomal protein S21 [Candidatus Zambryskibacteria bacterium]
MQSMVNIEVAKGPNENNLGVLRRFTKRVQAAGILPRVRSKRYSERTLSANTRKAKTVASIKKKKVTTELIKLGKMTEVTTFGRRKR